MRKMGRIAPVQWALVPRLQVSLPTVWRNRRRGAGAVDGMASSQRWPLSNPSRNRERSRKRRWRFGGEEEEGAARRRRGLGRRIRIRRSHYSPCDLGEKAGETRCLFFVVVTASSLAHGGGI